MKEKKIHRRRWWDAKWNWLIWKQVIGVENIESPTNCSLWSHWMDVNAPPLQKRKQKRIKIDNNPQKVHSPHKTVIYCDSSSNILHNGWHFSSLAQYSPPHAQIPLLFIHFRCAIRWWLIISPANMKGDMNVILCHDCTQKILLHINQMIIQCMH